MKSELERIEVYMTHANLRPAYDAVAVVRKAEYVARVLRSSQTGWKEVAAQDVHGLNGHRPRKLWQFNVTTGGGTYVFFLASGGVLLRETSDGFVPVQLNELSGHIRVEIRKTLEWLPSHPYAFSDS